MLRTFNAEVHPSCIHGLKHFFGMGTSSLRFAIPCWVFDGATSGINGTPEFAQNAIPHMLDDAAVMLSDLWFKKFTSMGIQACKRAFLGSSHQTAVPDDICREDGS